MKSIVEFITEKQNFLIKGHTKDQSAVDLDLPSGIKWATCNIGAYKPEDYGLYFQWGRMDGYKYGDKNHKFLSIDDYVTTSGKEYKKNNVLKPEDDVAYHTTHGKFRMPTKKEIKELTQYTDNKWAELNGVKGMKFISTKDESKWIFIPAAGGFGSDTDVFEYAGEYGYTWSASADSDKDAVEPGNYAWTLWFWAGESDTCGVISCCDGYPVRGVCK